MSRCKITELLQDIWSWLVSTTHLPPCHLSHFQKKKEKEILINQIVCAYSANDHDPSACKYFIAVKWLSFFWLSSLCLGDLKIEILNKVLNLKLPQNLKVHQNFSEKLGPTKLIIAKVLLEKYVWKSTWYKQDQIESN